MSRRATLSSAEEAVAALTREIPSHVDRLAAATGSPSSELWSLYLAATGVMFYADPRADDPAAPRILGVPDGFARPAGTRFALWRRSLESLLVMLGDPEAGYRTGSDTTALGRAVEELFGRPRPRTPRRST